MKKCLTCKDFKSQEDFPPNKKNKDGLNRKCRECYNEYMRLWYLKNSEVHKARVNSYNNRRGPVRQSSRYSLSEDELAALYLKYDGLCWICKSNRATCIDHDHSCCSGGVRVCGKCVRGVLCTSCNTGLGMFRDDTQNLSEAIEYLKSSSLIPSVL